MSGAKQGLFDPEELQGVNITFVDPFWFDSSNSLPLQTPSSMAY
jgi:hypothetical protein